MIVHFHNAVGNKAQIVDIGHTLTVTKAGSGSVKSSPSGIRCGRICVGSFATGASVKLTATPGPKTNFAGWSGGRCRGAHGCRVKLNADTSVKARFKRDRTRPKVTRARVKANHATDTARVTLRGTDPEHGSKGLRFMCKLDSGHYTRCRSSKLYKGLFPGTHTLQVEAVDRAGNRSKPVTRRFGI